MSGLAIRLKDGVIFQVRVLKVPNKINFDLIWQKLTENGWETDAEIIDNSKFRFNVKSYSFKEKQLKLF